ncbi:IucA/IucC family protein [Peredibacter starrii]|uniref:IucA/IucC family protein n=1 Tax=Peredibacter starrii TaxID=28202 RepID=A0AAX4HLL5_9BACT|nr:IucA/IucC family protein [Peredibacter starrii]WPU64101.1 IucA/IucC family protein [Peredibacter starrii]
MLASLHSATCFYNSLFLEWRQQRLGTFQGQNAFFVLLNPEQELVIPLKRHSRLGRHEYQGTFFIGTKGDYSSVSFSQSVELMLNVLAKTEDEIQNIKNFVSRVKDSEENIRFSLKLRKSDFESIFTSLPDFKDAERALFVGHAFHPAPKNKTGFNQIDAKLFSPECGGQFPLRWFWVANDMIYQKSSEVFEDLGWLNKMWKEEFPHRPAIEGYQAFPMHPWQAQHILSMPIIQTYMKEGRMIEMNETGPDWYPTTSLRTIYRENADYMLKFSLNVKLTNSMRHLLEHELLRGLQVHEVFNTTEGKTLLETHPGFNVVFEPSYYAIKDENGAPIKETFVVCRENSFKSDKVKHVVLAVLTQDHPDFKENLLQTLIKKYAEENKTDYAQASEKWFELYLKNAVAPMLDAQKNFGILLGAHQQNLIIGIENNLPVKATFRDCHGTGYSPLGFELFGKSVKSIDIDNGNILNYEIANYLFTYYLIINSTFNVMTAIAQGNAVSEEKLIHQMRSFLEATLAEDPKDPSCIQYLLNDKVLQHKGNFLCSLRNINENTAKNPLDIYVQIPNPFLVGK